MVLLLLRQACLLLGKKSVMLHQGMLLEQVLMSQIGAILKLQVMLMSRNQAIKTTEKLLMLCIMLQVACSQAIIQTLYSKILWIAVIVEP